MHMYNFDGLWYQLKYAPTTLFLIPFLVLFIISIIKKNKKNFYFYLASLILFSALTFKNVNSIINPDIKVYEGVFVEDYSWRTSYHAPFIWEFCFEGSGKIKGLYLPARQLPFELEKGKEYKVFYEDANDIIVKIEPIGDVCNTGDG